MNPIRSSDAAFPGVVSSGMSLRQWYIGMALQGVLASGRFEDGSDASKMAVAAADSALRRMQNGE